MVYVCEKCPFVFERIGGADTCPICGRPSVREATIEEEIAYFINGKKPINDEKTKL